MRIDKAFVKPRSGAYLTLKQCLGFTWLEIMISIVIVGVLALAAVPVVRHLVIQSRVIAASENFAEQIRLARSEAIQRQLTVYVNLKTGSSWCYGSKSSSTCDCSLSSNCSMTSVSGSIYPSVTVSATGFTGGNVSFDSTRGLLSEASTVSFNEDDKTITVTLSRLGLVSLCSTNVSGYTAC